MLSIKRVMNEICWWFRYAWVSKSTRTSYWIIKRLHRLRKRDLSFVMDCIKRELGDRD